MRYKNITCSIKTLGMLLAILFFGTSCEDNDSSGTGQDGIAGNGHNVFLRFEINTTAEAILRANPNGGQDGDGQEDALENEHAINNLTVVFYRGTDLNSSLSAVVDTAIYIPSGEILNGNTTTVQKISIQQDMYHVLVVANAGNIAPQFNGKTVKQFCDYLQATAWMESGNSYSGFIMSSSGDVFTDLSIPSTEASPVYISIDLQRMAARLDFIPNQGDNGTNTYTVSDAGGRLATVRLERAKLMNLLSAGTYMIKRVADDITATPVYLGEETPASGVQTNYVLDPWTTVKITDNVTGAYFSMEGGAGSSPAASLYRNYYDEALSLDGSNNIQEPMQGYNFYILDYTMENTMGVNYQINGYSTGIMLQTRYIPHLVTNYNPVSNTNEITDNNDVITFFTIDNNTVYNSLEAIGLPYLAEPLTGGFFSQLFNINNTWV